MEGPVILKSEVRLTLVKIDRNKTARSDGIVMEILLALDNFRIGKITEIINEICDSDNIPGCLSRSIYILLPKKPSANE